MRAGSYLDALRSSPLTTTAELTKARPFVILSPHPDDETLGAGGLIAEACASNQNVHVVVVTDGAGSHPRSKRYPKERLVQLRYSEVRKAGLALGLEEERVTFLGLPDTLSPTSGPLFDEAVKAISSVIRNAEAGALFVTWEGDPHCDHESAAALAKAVVKVSPGLKLWAYPIWGWHLDAATETHQLAPNAFRIDISQHRDRKRQAIEAHASQMTNLISDDPDGFRFDEVSLAPFLGRYEYFIEVAV